MSSIGDAMSTIAPLSSPTSRTSATTIELPANELHTLRPSRTGVGGPRKMDLANSTGPHIGAYNATALRRVFEYAGEDRDLTAHNSPLLLTGQVPSPRHIPALRRQSTKQLIHRFESMTNAAEMTQVKRLGSVHPSSVIDTHDTYRPFLTVVPHKSKRRSFSNSLRNFMSVFKKKKDKESDDDVYISPFHIHEQNIVASEEPAPSKSPKISRPSGSETPLSPNSDEPVLSGSLLYLSRPPSCPPVWMSCTVALYNSHLLITWYTMHDSPSNHIVQLDGFMDVHSLNERVSRPDTEGDLKTFELTFEGRSREMFAAASVQDRARWVGAIWDAILNSQRKNGTMHSSKRGETLTVRTDVTPEHENIGQWLQSPSSPAEARSEYTSSGGSKTPLARRSPPPTPVAKSPRHSLSPLSVSPPRPPSQFSNAHSRSRSPSIANLGTLSVVTQRLAQIERSELGSPAPSVGASSSVGTALRRAQTTHSTHQGHPFAEIEKLQEDNAEGNWCKVVETPSTDASIVIPLPSPPNAPFFEASSVRSAFKRNRTEHQPLSVLAPPSSPTRASAAIATPVAALRSKLSEPAIREHVENPPTSLLAVGVEPQLAPLAELIKDTAAKHYDQTAGLGEQIISLQRDIHILPNEIQILLGKAVTAATKPASKSNGAIDNASLQNVLSSVEGLRKQILASSEHSQIDSLVRMFEDLRSQLAALAPLLMEKLASIEQGQTQLQLQAEHHSADIRTAGNLDIQGGVQDGSSNTSVDLSDIHSKLDELVSLYGSGAAATCTEDEAHNIPHKLQAVLDHLRLDEEQRKLQIDQQADSVRYLNELNLWLETFVNGGTAHIQSVAANVEQLCSHLGVPLESDNATRQLSSQGMLGEIRQLISSVETKTSSEGQLQAAVGELVEAVREQMKNGTEQRTTLVTESVLEIISRQRHEQEQMLRALSTELTSEIRGERLRFVEAMKEATAINVQAHVEHFKAELGREVAAMTQDVGRLHQEKQVIEQQIADLFTFYSKQKQEAENNVRRNVPPRSTGFSNLQNLPSSAPKRPRRPLPHPVFQKKN